jgi:hypothetical protein
MTSSDTPSAALIPRWRRCGLPGRARKQKPLASLDLISGGVFPAPSLLAYIGHLAYSLDALRADLSRSSAETRPNARNRPLTVVTSREQ